MRGELFRLSTFSSFTGDASVSALTLARCGFYYDGTQGTIRCEACDVGFDPLEHSNSSILDRHREQPPGCPFALAASTPNTPPSLPGLALPVGGHTASDDGSQIGPDDIMWRTYGSALARATKQGVFQATADTNTEPSGSVSLPEAHADLQALNEGHVVYRREQPSIWPVHGSGSDSPSGANAHSQVSTQGNAVYRRQPSGSDLPPGSNAHSQGSTQGHALYRSEPSGSDSPPGSHAYPQGSTHAVSRREQLDYQRLQHEESRLHTFTNWPVDARVDAQALAREGFFYTGQGDRVQCAFCRGHLKNWKATDVIKTKHQKYSPNCPFLRGLVVSGQLSREQTSQPSSLDSQESDQRATFDDPESAVMDREEVSVLIPIIQNLGLSENDLRTLVRERLTRGDDCLSPRMLLEALLMNQRM